MLLTAFHNLHWPDVGHPEEVTAGFDFRAGRAGDSRNQVRCRVESIVGDESLDWAAIQLDHALDDRDVLALGSPYALDRGGALIIIQHPLGGYKLFAIEFEALLYADDEVLQYQAPTPAGSAGAPVFDARMHVIALHHARTQIERAGGQVEWRSEGIRIERIMEGLEKAGIPFESGLYG
jgi:hypothetical protein